jgi:hypothetical protein
LVLVACGRPVAGDPLAAVFRGLAGGETILYARTLPAPGGNGPAAGAVAVVRDAGGRLELRLFDWDGEKAAPALAAQGGETFLDLDLLDADGDSQPDIVATWGGGHLSMVEVLARGPDGAWRSLLNDAGSEIEIGRCPGGRLELAIISRTFEEGEGQPPIYERIPYRWDGARLAPVPPARPPAAP